MTRLTIPALAAALLLGALATHAFAARRIHALTEAQARNEITLDGYRNVRDVHKVKDGWVATADEGGNAVSVLADNRGDVMKQ